jgi:hypothetical protein
MIYLFSEYLNKYNIDYTHFFYKDNYIYLHDIRDDIYVKYLWIDNEENFADNNYNPIIDIKKFKYNLPTILNIIQNDSNLYKRLSNSIDSIIFGKLC